MQRLTTFKLLAGGLVLGSLLVPLFASASYGYTITTPYWCGSFYSSVPCVGGYYGGNMMYTNQYSGQQYYYNDGQPNLYTGYGYSNNYNTYNYTYPSSNPNPNPNPNLNSYWGQCYYTSGIGPSYRYPCQYQYQNQYYNNQTYPYNYGNSSGYNPNSYNNWW